MNAVFFSSFVGEFFYFAALIPITRQMLKPLRAPQSPTPLCRTVRYESLSQHYWGDLAHVRHFAIEWMWQYNREAA
jgi:hypothetical protein